MKKPRNTRKLIGNILFFSLLVSVVFVVIRLILAPSDAEAGADAPFVKSDYVLTLLQCVLGLVVMMLPTAIERKWSVDIPNFMYILYYVFLYCAVFLGEVFDFYYTVPHWDTILHAFSGATLGALGFILVSLLNDAKTVRVSLSPFFVSLFAFCFALAAGAVWEIYEFSVDRLMGLNMQKYATEAGELLIGPNALRDTMKDIIVDALAALAVSTVGYFSILKQKKADD